MYYEEWIGGSWQRIHIDGEMLLGRAHHVIYSASAGEWQKYPEWARHRRNEIIPRITSEFREPDYQHQMDTGGIPLPSSGDASACRSQRRFDKGSQVTSLVAVIAILLALAAAMVCLVMRGLRGGETFMPSKHSSHHRVLNRQQEPASYWMALGVYAMIGLASGSGAIWMLRHAWKHQNRRPSASG